ncbi:four helix bundle protein [Planctomycetota bacterium]
MAIKTYKDLEVYSMAYQLAMDIFKLTRSFPREEKYSLIGQILSSSRSVAANIVEGWSKRRYANVFKRQLNDALGSATETQTWLDFARDCGYLESPKHKELYNNYDKLGGKIQNLMNRWRSFK